MNAFDIMIGHSDPLARAHLQTLLPAEFVIGHAENFGSLAESVKEVRDAQLIILDWGLPGLAGDVGVRYLASHFPATPVAVLYSHLPEHALDELLGSPVRACVPKELCDADLRSVFLKVLHGETHKPDRSSFASPKDVHLRDLQRSFLEQELTGRQVEVLRFLAQGHSNREIAERLHISEGTVKVHVNALFRSLGVHNRVGAAAAWTRLFDEREHLDH